MIYLRIAIIIYTALSATVHSHAKILNESNSASNDNQTSESPDFYLAQIDDGFHSSELYFNLANIYYSKNDLPRAKLYYEKALKLSPFNGDIRHNLQIVNRNIDSDIPAIPDHIFLKLWKDFINILYVDIWTLLSIISAITFIVLLALKWFFTTTINSIWPFMAFLLFLFLTIISSNSYNYHSKSSLAILMNNARLHAGPSEKSTVIYNLKAGEKLKINDSLENWFHVILVNKEQGWIAKYHTEKI